MKKTSPLLIIVSSPSGAGKTTLCKMLLETFKDLRFSISHTTRPPRPREVDGRDYFFVSDKAFDDMTENDEFIEWAHVHGNRYGTARKELRSAALEGVDLLFDVDYQGAVRIKEQYPEAVGVFVLPPSIEELQNRLSKRGTESAEAMQRRFKAALEEIRHAKFFDYLLVNDDLETASKNLRSIVRAERIRQSRMQYLADEMLQM